MNKSNVIAGLVCLAFGAYVLWLAQGVPATTMTDTVGGRFFPQTISILLILASIGLIVTGWLNIEISGGTAPKLDVDAAPAADPEPASAAAAEAAREPRFGPNELRLLGFVGVMLIYTVLLPLIGYIIASIITFAALVAIAGERRPVRVIAASLGITAALYLIFAVLLGMNVPEASLF